MIKLVGVLPKLSLLLVGFLVLAGALMTAIENNKVIVSVDHELYLAL